MYLIIGPRGPCVLPVSGGSSPVRTVPAGRWASGGPRSGVMPACGGHHGPTCRARPPGRPPGAWRGINPFTYAAAAAGVLADAIGSAGMSAATRSRALPHAASCAAGSVALRASTMAWFISSFLYANSGSGERSPGTRTTRCTGSCRCRANRSSADEPHRVGARGLGGEVVGAPRRGLGVRLEADRLEVAQDRLELALGSGMYARVTSTDTRSRSSGP